MFREAFMIQFSYSMEIEDLNRWVGQLSAGGFIMMPGMALAFTSGLDDLCPVAYRRLPGPMSLFHQLEQQQGPEPGFSHLRFFQNGPTSTWFVVHSQGKFYTGQHLQRMGVFAQGSYRFADLRSLNCKAKV